MSAEEIHKHKPTHIKPQGHDSGLDADKVNGFHASEIGGGGGGPHASTHETGGADKVHFADLEHDEGDATLHDNLTSTPHISQVEKNKIHDRLHALDSSLDHIGTITDSQHGDKASIPNAHHAKVHALAHADHSDVSISNPADGEVLTYEASSVKWKNKPPAGGAPTGLLKLLGYCEGTTNISFTCTDPPCSEYIPDIDMTLSVRGGKRVLVLFSIACRSDIAGVRAKFIMYADTGGFGGGILYFPTADTNVAMAYPIVLLGSFVPASDMNLRFRVVWELWNAFTIYNRGTIDFRRRLTVLQET